jgi:hypothetical protein
MDNLLFEYHVQRVYSILESEKSLEANGKLEQVLYMNVRVSVLRHVLSYLSLLEKVLPS